jgi:ParB-like chromosome segregation protein Spo0J
MVDEIIKSFSFLEGLSLDEKVTNLNIIRRALAEYSPFKSEPVDCIEWVKNTNVKANDYNPNSVAPPEMELLKHSILSDGYTQPIVAWLADDGFEVVDGFHRSRVGKECEEVRVRVSEYLPLVVINEKRSEKGDRISSTIRHNRARGKHAIDAMSQIVVDLKKRNWSDAKIAKELGMDQDEVLRLCQLSGLREMFKDSEFTQSWEIENAPDLEMEENE